MDQIHHITTQNMPHNINNSPRGQNIIKIQAVKTYSSAASNKCAVQCTTLGRNVLNLNPKSKP